MRVREVNSLDGCQAGADCAEMLSRGACKHVYRYSTLVSRHDRLTAPREHGILTVGWRTRGCRPNVC